MEKRKMAEKREQDRVELEKCSKEALIETILQLKNEKAAALLEIKRLEGEKTRSEILESKQEPKTIAREDKEKPERCISKDRRSRKQQKPFDFSRYSKRHIALKISYLGWAFHGFASQENVENTVEAHLFDALKKCCLIESRASCNYSRCGRTDKGVSAFGQVISLDVRSNLLDGVGVIQLDTDKVRERIGAKESQEINYIHVLNKVLPDEIKVIAWAAVAPSFDARFSCVSRHYKFYFPAGNMDIDIMNQAAQKFVGEHDFRNFCKMDVANGVVTFQRSIRSIRVERLQTRVCKSEFELCEITVCGSAFLWHQVRCIVAILFLIGQRLESPEVIDWMLDVKQCPRRPQYNMASELPLILYDCEFEDISWIYQPECVLSTVKNLQSHWTTHSVRSAIVENLITIVTESPAPQQTPTRTEVPFSKSNLMPSNQVSCLVQGIADKGVYIKLAKRKTCDSLEEKLETLSAKKKRTGKSPVISSDYVVDPMKLENSE